MADVGVVYTLTTPGPDIVFNQFTDPFIGEDQYYITEIRGLMEPEYRTPTDNVPLGDGAIIHDYWTGAYHIGIEGLILVQSTRIENEVVEIRNDMESDLKSAIRSILRADGTLVYTPQGQSAVTFTVRAFVRPDTVHTDNYRSLQFSFELTAARDPA